MIFVNSQKDSVIDHELTQNSTGVTTENKVFAQEPPMFKVLLINDDYTPMDFVVEILESVFHKSKSAATKIMLDVHNKGVGICGVYPFDIAETKLAGVQKIARDKEHPLKCTMERE